MSSILIYNGSVMPNPGTSRLLYKPGYVFIRENLIEAVEQGSPPEGLFQEASQAIDLQGKLVIPGLINAHTHLFQTFLRGLADDKPLLHWLEAAIWPGGASMTEEDFYLASLLGFVENIKSGATSVLNQDYVQTSTRNMDRIAEAAWKSGIRTVLARGFADRDNYHPKFVESTERVLKETERLVKSWNQRGSGRVRVEFGPLIPWGVHKETLQTINRLAHEWDTGVHIHLSETVPEVQMSLDEYGVHPGRWLHDIGVLNERWQLVHCVWLEEEEIKLIADAGSVIVHCPTSNMYLASGIPQVTKWLKHGIPTALATDGPGSNNSQDNLETLKFTACLQKVGTMDAMALLPEAVLRMNYEGGARAIRQDGRLGSLEPGKLADITVVNLKRPHIAPVHSAASALVYNANGNDVDLVIIDGRLVLRDGKMVDIDEDKLVEECQTAAEAMAIRAGIITKSTALA
jgi:5-methylthioadenosine/S-adenosylhomocysteine deaminase